MVVITRRLRYGSPIAGSKPLSIRPERGVKCSNGLMSHGYVIDLSNFKILHKCDFLTPIPSRPYLQRFLCNNLISGTYALDISETGLQSGSDLTTRPWSGESRLLGKTVTVREIRT